MHRLGDIHYRGIAEGRLHDLTLHGAFRTALGTITTDGSFRSDSLFEHMDYDAKIVGRKFRLGRLLNQPKIGSLTLDFQSRGEINNGVVEGDIKAHLRQFTYNGYTYEDLRIDGHYAPKHYKGQFRIRDPHMDMAFDGVVNLRDEDPEINFNLRCKNFATFPLIDKDSQFGLRSSFGMAVDLSGSKPDEMSGYLVIDSL
jgi:hypothetical protein